MPKKIIQKARQVDGMQFDGSDESAERIVEWVDSLHGNCWWSKSNLAVSTDAGLYYVELGGWVIRDEDFEFRVITEKEFNEQFEVEDA